MAGMALSGAGKAIPWIVDSDLQMLVLCGQGGKQAMCLAQLVCHATRTSGVTSLNVVEHDLMQKGQD